MAAGGPGSSVAAQGDLVVIVIELRQFQLPGRAVMTLDVAGLVINIQFGGAVAMAHRAYVGYDLQRQPIASGARGVDFIDVSARGGVSAVVVGHIYRLNHVSVVGRRIGPGRGSGIDDIFRIKRPAGIREAAAVYINDGHVGAVLGRGLRRALFYGGLLGEGAVAFDRGKARTDVEKLEHAHVIHVGLGAGDPEKGGRELDHHEDVDLLVAAIAARSVAEEYSQQPGTYAFEGICVVV